MRLFVGNLKRQVTESELTRLFSTYGTVLSSSVRGSKFSADPNTHAFVDMQDDAGGDAAIAALNNTIFLEQAIIVTVAKANKKNKWRYPGVNS